VIAGSCVTVTGILIMLFVYFYIGYAPLAGTMADGIVEPGKTITLSNPNFIAGKEISLHVDVDTPLSEPTLKAEVLQADGGMLFKKEFQTAFSTLLKPTTNGMHTVIVTNQGDKSVEITILLEMPPSLPLLRPWDAVGLFGIGAIILLAGSITLIVVAIRFLLGKRRKKNWNIVTSG